MECRLGPAKGKDSATSIGPYVVTPDELAPFLRDGRLHDARHTAATVLLLLGVNERAVMGIMGWSSTSMAARYQHVTVEIRRDIAKQVDGLIWAPKKPKKKARKQPGKGATETKTETSEP